MWHERNREHPNYARITYVFRQHAARYRDYVAAHGLLCQECGGAGEFQELISYELGGPWYDCGICEGTGKVTRWMRGQWLRWKRDEKRAKGQRTREKKAQAA